VDSGHAVAIRSRDEIASAIRGLTPAQWARLRKVANRYAFGRPIEPNDLLQEAFARALDENGRKCPADVEVVKFLAEAMRSIAHGEAEKVENRPMLVPIASHSDQEDGTTDPPDPALSVEEWLVRDQDAAVIRRDLLALFDDDPQARDIVEGTMEGLNADELRELTSLDKTAYDSKRKLIRRRIDKKYPEGWRP